MEAFVPRVVDHSLRLVDHDLEIATILVFRPYALCILFQLRGVVGLGENVFQKDRMGNTNRLQILHGGAQDPCSDVFVALELDLAHFDLGPFLHHERDSDRRRRNLPYFRPDGRKLVSVLREQALDGDFRLLKAVEHVAGRDRAQAEVIYFADGWLFPYLEDDPPALGRLLPEDLDIFEVACVPQRVEVALQAGWVVDVPGMSKNARPNGIGGNTAVALNVNFRDYVGLR